MFKGFILWPWLVEIWNFNPFVDVICWFELQVEVGSEFKRKKNVKSFKFWTMLWIVKCVLPFSSAICIGGCSWFVLIKTRLRYPSNIYISDIMVPIINRPGLYEIAIQLVIMWSQNYKHIINMRHPLLKLNRDIWRCQIVMFDVFIASQDWNSLWWGKKVRVVKILMAPMCRLLSRKPWTKMLK